MKYMDEAISEIDNMESLISTYKIHLNVRNSLSVCTYFSFLILLTDSQRRYSLHSIPEQGTTSTNAESKSTFGRTAKSSC